MTYNKKTENLFKLKDRTRVNNHYNIGFNSLSNLKNNFVIL